MGQGLGATEEWNAVWALTRAGGEEGTGRQARPGLWQARRTCWMPSCGADHPLAKRCLSRRSILVHRVVGWWLWDELGWL